MISSLAATCLCLVLGSDAGTACDITVKVKDQYDRDMKDIPLTVVPRTPPYTIIAKGSTGSNGIWIVGASEWLVNECRSKATDCDRLRIIPSGQAKIAGEVQIRRHTTGHWEFLNKKSNEWEFGTAVLYVDYGVSRISPPSGHSPCVSAVYGAAACAAYPSKFRYYYQVAPVYGCASLEQFTCADAPSGIIEFQGRLYRILGIVPVDEVPCDVRQRWNDLGAIESPVLPGPTAEISVPSTVPTAVRHGVAFPTPAPGEDGYFPQ